jgi:hypothetical protein
MGRFFRIAFYSIVVGSLYVFLGVIAAGIGLLILFIISKLFSRYKKNKSSHAEV